MAEARRDSEWVEASGDNSGLGLELHTLSREQQQRDDMREAVRRRLFASAPHRSLADPNATEAPAYIGRYRIDGRLGRGGMGIVYSGFDETLGRPVAIKVLHADRGESTSHGEVRLIREAQALARLSHPSVIQVYEVGRVDEQVFIAMEFVEGVTLRVWQSDPERSWITTLAAYRSAAEGLAAAHALDIVHRDFKPENVLVRHEDHAIRIIDFGLAQTPSGLEPPTNDIPITSTAIAKLTQSGSIIGTPAYMAPEQFKGAPADARTDQFSFCVALFEALYGYRPFTGTTVRELARAVMDGEPEPCPPYSDIPAPLYRVLRKGLSVDPQARYASIHDLIAALPSPTPSRTRAWMTGGALLLIGGLLIGGWSVGTTRAKQHATRMAMQTAFHNLRERHAVARIRARPPPSASHEQQALLQAHANASTSPTHALARLKQIDPYGPGYSAARLIAAEALAYPRIETSSLAPIEIQRIRLSDDGQTVVLAGGDAAVVRWRRRDAQPEPLGELSTTVQSLAISPDGSTIAAIDQSGEMAVWGDNITRFPPIESHRTPAWVAIDHTGHVLASASVDGVIRRYQSGQTQVTRWLRRGKTITAIAAAANGSIAIGTENGRVHLLRDENEARSWTLSPNDAVVRLDFRDHDHRIDALTTSGTMIAIDLLFGRGRPRPGPPKLARVTWDEHGTRALGWSPSLGLVRLDGDDRHTLLKPSRQPPELAMTPDGTLAVEASGRQLRWWHLGEPPQSHIYRHSNPLLHLAWNRSTGHLVAGSEGGAILLWPDPSRGRPQPLGQLFGRIDGLAMRGDGQAVVASSSAQKGASIWDLATGQIQPLAEAWPVRAPMRWSTNGTLIAMAFCSASDACGWIIDSPDTSTPPQRSPLGAPVRLLAAPLDGSFLALRTDDSADWYDPTSGQFHRLRWTDKPRPIVGFARTDETLRVATFAPTKDQSIMTLWSWSSSEQIFARLISQPADRVVTSMDGQTIALLSKQTWELWHLDEPWAHVVDGLPIDMNAFQVNPERTLVLASTSAATDVIDPKTGTHRTFPAATTQAWLESGSLAFVAPETTLQVYEDPTPRDPAQWRPWIDAKTQAVLVRDEHMGWYPAAHGAQER